MNKFIVFFDICPEKFRSLYSDSLYNSTTVGTMIRSFLQVV